MEEVASPTTTNTTTLTFTVAKYTFYNDGIDNHCFITSIYAADATVTSKYFIDKKIIENIPGIAKRISSILGKVHRRSSIKRNIQSTAPLPSSLTSQQRKQLFH